MIYRPILYTFYHIGSLIIINIYLSTWFSYVDKKSCILNCKNITSYRFTNLCLKVGPCHGSARRPAVRVGRTLYGEECGGSEHQHRHLGGGGAGAGRVI